MKQAEKRLSDSIISSINSYEFMGSMVVVAAYNIEGEIVDDEQREELLDIYRNAVKKVIDALCAKVVLNSPYKKKYAIISQEDKDEVYNEVIQLVSDILHGQSHYSPYLGVVNDDDDEMAKSVVAIGLQLTISQDEPDTLKCLSCFGKLNDNDQYIMSDPISTSLH